MEQFFLNKKIVEYACLCGILSPLTKLYFCKHCLSLRCAFCCHHEVDSHFCSNCLENIPSSEAKLRKNKCNTCFDCPSCQATLSARATQVQVPMTSKGEGGDESAESTKMVSKKMYYLACLACRWTSRDVGISDQASQTCSWPEQEYFHSTRFQQLSEHYQAVVLHDKQERQDLLRKKSTKTKFPSMTDRTGLTVSSIRRSMGFDKTSAKPKPKPSSINPSVATSEIDELPDELFTQGVNLKSITTIMQRLAQPANQPGTVKHLYPQHKNLSIKRSLRCRHCEHNVIKPEYNPSSIKYRIQHFASCHVPEIRFVKADPPVGDGSFTVTLKIINPTNNQDMTITIMDLPTEEEENVLIEEMRKTFDKSVSIATKSSLTPSIMRPSLIEDPRPVNCKVTGKIVLPDSSFVVSHRDDSAEFDDDVQADRQDPEFIIWRKGNKVAIRMSVVPDSDLKANDDVLIGFTMQFTHNNAPASTPEKDSQPQRRALSVRAYVNAGKIAA